MKIGIIDADLIGKKNHNFPNLACLKLSGFHKKKGDEVELLTTYNDIDSYSLFNKHFDKVYISKVFTSIKVPEHILKLDFVEYGGTGFFYDKAVDLPYEIEHSMPDYNLYDSWIQSQIKQGKKEKYFKYYTDYSIGFTTRGCFRKCKFCINQNEKRVYPHSPLSEFLDLDRKKICLLDDNILGCGQHWERIISELQETNKKFQFRQGMDIRLMTIKRAEILNKSRFDGNIFFAFDSIKDSILIESKLKVWRKHCKKTTIFYILTHFGFDDYVSDIENIFKRIAIINRYRIHPYLMVYDIDNINAKYISIYKLIKNWMNSYVLFGKITIKEYDKKGVLKEFLKDNPRFNPNYFDLKFNTPLKNLQIKK